MCMQTLINLAEDRIRAELTDFELAVPNGLKRVLLDDLYYTATLLAVCADSFVIGLAIGWLATL